MKNTDKKERLITVGTSSPLNGKEEFIGLTGEISGLETHSIWIKKDIKRTKDTHTEQETEKETYYLELNYPVSEYKLSIIERICANYKKDGKSIIFYRDLADYLRWAFEALENKAPIIIDNESKEIFLKELADIMGVQKTDFNFFIETELQKGE